jgi:hypothetical protein
MPNTPGLAPRPIKGGARGRARPNPIATALHLPPFLASRRPVASQRRHAAMPAAASI